MEKTGRVSLPAHFRQVFGNSGVITRGLDGCLFVFSQTEWKLFTEQLESNSFARKADRDVTRLMLNSAESFECDDLGRFVIPEYLRTLAKLGPDVVFAGAQHRIEVWDRDTFHTYLDALDKNAESIVETFGQRQEAV